MNFSIKNFTKRKKSLDLDDQRWYHRIPRTSLALCFLAWLLLIWAGYLFIIEHERGRGNYFTPRHSVPSSPGKRFFVKTPPCKITLEGDNCVVRCDKVIAEHPGHVVAQYIAEAYPDYMDRCSSKKWNLYISDTLFPGHLLDSNWFQTDGILPPISSLELNGCSELSEIEDRAFSTSSAFGNNLEELVLTGNRALTKLHAGITDGLSALISFNWRQNGELETAESEAIHPFRHSLEILQIQGGFSTPSVLANLTGMCQGDTLPSLVTVDLRFNPDGMPSIGSRHLTALKSPLQIYLSSSNIKQLEGNDVFDSVAKSLKILDLSNNTLKSMRKGIFDQINAFSTSENKAKILLHDNPWVCDCNLQWLQDMIQDDNSHINFDPEPTCYDPVSKNESIIKVADIKTSCLPYPSEPPAEISCGSQTTTTQPAATETTNDPSTIISTTQETLTSTESETCSETTESSEFSSTTSDFPTSETMITEDNTDLPTTDTSMTIEITTDSSTNYKPTETTEYFSSSTETMTTEKPVECGSDICNSDNHNILFNTHSFNSRNIRSITSKFSVFEIENNGIENLILSINLKNFKKSTTKSIIWRQKDDYNTSAMGCCINVPTSKEFNISNFNFLRSTSYLFCMLDENLSTSLNDCEPLTTSLNYSDRPLLTNNDMTWFITLATILGIISLVGLLMTVKIINIKRRIASHNKKLDNIDGTPRTSDTSETSIPSRISIGFNIKNNTIAHGTMKTLTQNKY